MDVKYIVPETMIRFKNQITENRSTQARILPSISISMLITDIGGSIIFFPDLEGKPDYNTEFFDSKDNLEG
ncbi:MAG: hypothetical protein ACFFCZ_31360 [Promethearchaeota archaeon]